MSTASISKSTTISIPENNNSPALGSNEGENGTSGTPKVTTPASTNTAVDSLDAPADKAGDQSAPANVQQSGLQKPSTAGKRRASDVHTPSSPPKAEAAQLPEVPSAPVDSAKDTDSAATGQAHQDAALNANEERVQGRRLDGTRRLFARAGAGAKKVGRGAAPVLGGIAGLASGAFVATTAPALVAASTVTKIAIPAASTVLGVHAGIGAAKGSHSLANTIASVGGAATAAVVAGLASMPIAVAGVLAAAGLVYAAPELRAVVGGTALALSGLLSLGTTGFAAPLVASAMLTGAAYYAAKTNKAQQWSTRAQTSMQNSRVFNNNWVLPTASFLGTFGLGVAGAVGLRAA